MKKKFELINVVDNNALFNEMAEYEESLIKEATTIGALSELNANNEYTREIGRIGGMLADYESKYVTFNNLEFKSPSLVLAYA